MIKCKECNIELYAHEHMDKVMINHMLEKHNLIEYIRKKFVSLIYCDICKEYKYQGTECKNSKQVYNIDGGYYIGVDIHE